MANERRFPIQGERITDSLGKSVYRLAGEVPWGVAELAYKQYAKHYGTGQSLERLAERGGFDWSEMVSLLRGADGRLIPSALLQDACHASAPAGRKCADCSIDQEPCPICYETWWKKRHPNTTQV